MQFAPVYAFAGAVAGGFLSVSIKARYPMSVCSGMVCAVCPGLQSVTLAGRILKLRDLKLREDGHLRVTNAFTTHTFRQSKNLNTNQRLSQPPSTVQVQ